jgi:hypothetical protein
VVENCLRHFLENERSHDTRRQNSDDKLRVLHDTALLRSSQRSCIIIRCMCTLNSSEIKASTPTCSRKVLQIPIRVVTSSSLHFDISCCHLSHVRRSMHRPAHRHLNHHRHPTRMSSRERLAAAAAYAAALAAVLASVFCLTSASCLLGNLSCDVQTNGCTLLSHLVTHLECTRSLAHLAARIQGWSPQRANFETPGFFVEVF